MGWLYHLVARGDLADWSDGDSYRPPSLAAEGFIHLSTRTQVAGVAANRYRDVEDLVVLRIDDAELDDVRWEDLYGHGDFPHLYGPLPLAAVVDRAPYRAKHGVFADPVEPDGVDGD